MSDPETQPSTTDEKPEWIYYEPDPVLEQEEAQDEWQEREREEVWDR